MSVNPSVTISAVRAALPSSSAFVATVIPCENEPRPWPARRRAQRDRDRREHALGLILRRRRRLGRDEPIPEREDRVRERSPDVDAEQHAGQATARAAQRARRQQHLRAQKQGPAQAGPHESPSSGRERRGQDLLGLREVLVRRAVAVVGERHPLARACPCGCSPGIGAGSRRRRIRSAAGCAGTRRRTAR